MCSDELVIISYPNKKLIQDEKGCTGDRPSSQRGSRWECSNWSARPRLTKEQGTGRRLNISLS